MGYEDPTPDIVDIATTIDQLRRAVLGYYDYVPDSFRDVFIRKLKEQSETLGVLLEELRNYGEAGVMAGTGHPMLPVGSMALRWIAINGMPVWRVERVTMHGQIQGSSRQEFDPAPDEAEIAIYLDKYDDAGLDRIQDAAIQLAASLGYGDFSLLEEERGSIFRRWTAKLRSGLESDYVKRRMEEIEERTSFEVIGKIRAENDGIKADNAVKLIASLSEIPNAVVRVGGIMVIKQTLRGSSQVLVRELNTKEIRALERHPGIQRDPEHALELLAVAVQELDHDLGGREIGS